MTEIYISWNKVLLDKYKQGWGASLVAFSVKNPPGMRETWVRYLGWEDPLEEGMATHSSSLAWRIPIVRSLVGHIQSMEFSRPEYWSG